MQLLKTIDIPQFYSLFCRSLGDKNASRNMRRVDDYGNFTRESRYRCEKCHTNFTVSHNFQQGMFYTAFGDDYVVCPSCGHSHVRLRYFSDIYEFRGREEKENEWETAPTEMRISLYEVQDGFILKAASTVIQMDDTDRTILSTREEEFRFDVKHRKTLFRVKAGPRGKVAEEIEFGNPFDETVHKKSMLWHVRTGNLVFRWQDKKDGGIRKKEDVRKDVTELLKRLREGIQKKWKALHGYDLKSLYVTTGREYGAMLFPLMNMAFRLVYPDARNLPKELATSITDYGEGYEFLQACLLDKDARSRYADFETIRKAPSSAQAIIKAFHLKDKPFIRRVLAESIFRAPELSRLQGITQNPDYQQRILAGVKARCAEPGENQWWTQSYTLAKRYWLYTLLSLLRPYWPDEKLCRLLEGKESTRELNDIYHMLARLGKEHRGKLTKVRTRDLHDFLVGALEKQKEKGYELPVPEPVQKRVAMQIENGAFQTFLPKHSHDLDHASAEFHNCVKTYSERVLNGQCNIVLMADDKGRLTACLEIHDQKLVQAKLRYNKPVWKDETVNRAVCDWCEKAQLMVRTPDVRQEPPEEAERKTA